MKVTRIIGFGAALALMLSVSASAMEMSHWALIRDDAGEVIGQIDVGEEVEVLGTCEYNPSRSEIYYPAADLYGTVASVYIYGGTDEEYENPNDFVYDEEGNLVEKDESDDEYEDEFEDEFDDDYDEDSAYYEGENPFYGFL